MKYLFFLLVILIVSCTPQKESHNLRLWYNQPAVEWTEALPVGNGRLGAMVYGGVEQEHIQFNEETLWTGQPHNYAHKGASDYLDEIRTLLFEGKQKEAETLAMDKFMSDPLRQKAYQPFGDVYIKFPGHDQYTNYYRELDLKEAICRTTYRVKNTTFSREVFASHPDQLIVIRLEADRSKSLNFELGMDADHENKVISYENGLLILEVAVKDGVMKGVSKISVNTDGNVNIEDNEVVVSNAGEATIFLSASTNYLSYQEVSAYPSNRVDEYLSKIEGQSFKNIRERHIADYQQLFNRFILDLGTNAKDTLPVDERIRRFQESPDPQLVSLYVQYGRYLLISSSRPGTNPANLQGIWN
ncbi:MAG: glycoside hydrolase family 95 protein, partial [Cyclobacteriaceae bacterium]|nr:glycoside hydrolase family 95 protein [Cyclobacteriaceae bacterium]